MYKLKSSQLQSLSFFNTILLLYVLAPSVATGGLKTAEQFQNQVYRLKTSSSADESKNSYGTAFVIDKNGILLTNYHVVSSAVQRPDQYKAFLVLRDQKSIPATILAVNIIDDLAIVKVDKLFQAIQPKYALKTTKGQTIYSLGFPEDLNAAIIKGTSNGILEYGPYKQLHLSTPMNSGMSGGPSITESGLLAGVNVAILRQSQNISFSVPAVRVKAFIENSGVLTKNPKSMDTDTEDLHTQIQNQLIELNDKITKSWTSEETQIGDLKYWKPDATLKCWSGQEEEQKNQIELYSQACSIGHQAYIQSSLRIGSYGYRAYRIKNLNLNQFQFTDYLNRFHNQQSEILAGSSTIGVKSNPYTNFECDSKFIVNENDIPLKFTYCLRGYKRYKDVLDLRAKVITLDSSNEAYELSFNLSGFTNQSLQTFLKRMLESLKR